MVPVRGARQASKRKTLLAAALIPGALSTQVLAGIAGLSLTPSRQPCRPHEAWETTAMMDTVLFTDHDILVFAIASSDIVR